MLTNFDRFYFCQSDWAIVFSCLSLIIQKAKISDKQENTIAQSD